MRQKVSPWGDSVSDADLAYALLGLGLLHASLYRNPVAALEALAAILQRDKDQAYRWRFDKMPSNPQTWGRLPDATSLAAAVRDFSGPRPLRFALLPGSVLSTVDFRSFVATALMAHEVATYVAGQSSRRQLQRRWPLRIGFPPGPGAEEHVADMRALDSWGGNVYEAFVPSRRSPECDFLVCVEHQSDATEMLKQASREVGTVRADLVVVFTRAEAAPSNAIARLDEARALADAGGSVHLGEAHDYPKARLRSVCIET